MLLESWNTLRTLNTLLGLWTTCASIPSLRGAGERDRAGEGSLTCQFEEFPGTLVVLASKSKNWHLTLDPCLENPLYLPFDLSETRDDVQHQEGLLWSKTSCMTLQDYCKRWKATAGCIWSTTEQGTLPSYWQISRKLRAVLELASIVLCPAPTNACSWSRECKNNVVVMIVWSVINRCWHAVGRPLKESSRFFGVISVIDTISYYHKVFSCFLHDPCSSPFVPRQILFAWVTCNPCRMRTVCGTVKSLE